MSTKSNSDGRNSTHVAVHDSNDDTAATMECSDIEGNYAFMPIKHVDSNMIQKSFMIQNKTFNPSDYPLLCDELKRRWNNALSTLLLMQSQNDDKSNRNNNWDGDDTTNGWFDKLYKQHNEDGRYYHTTMHLKEMLDYIDVFMMSATADDTQSNEGHVKLDGQQRIKPLTVSILTLATFFHDAVYDPKSTTNEKDSAILFQQFCSEWTASVVSSVTPAPHNPVIVPAVQEVIVTYILATEKHKVIPITLPNNNNAGDEEETILTWTVEEVSTLHSYQELFLDIDMSVLGKTVDAYMSYANCIRKEYSFVDHDIYCEKRAIILQSFLNNNTHIYLTNAMRDTLEQNARSNLQQEINLLKEKKIP